MWQSSDKGGRWVEDHARDFITTRINLTGVTCGNWLDAIYRGNPFPTGDPYRGLWRLYAVDQLKQEFAL